MSSSKDDGMSSYIKSKLLGAYKSTKESPYVQSLYNETAAAFSSGNSYIERGFNAGDSKQFPDQLEKLPSNTQIIMYPAYAKFENGYYITRIKGTVIATGIMNRTNRFLLNMARRISKSSDAEIGDSGSLGSQFEKEIKDAITYQENYRRNDEETSQYSNSITADDTLKSRMQGILAKTIPNVTLDVTIGTAVAGVELVKSEVRTDNFGIFQISVTTPYKPHLVEVSSRIDNQIIQTGLVEIIGNKGVSIITDIDDTVRVTGVLGEKRELFRNIFSRPYSACEIPGMSPWFQELHDVYNCPIHYVSNSPWQVYNIVFGFLDYFDFPVSSIHLRQYSGNLVASFTQPSAERKRPSLVTLFDDFPDRNFILIGDSGEQDLEAYLSLITQYSDRILAIYIRAVPNSFSSLGNSLANLKELKKILSSRKHDVILSENLGTTIRDSSTKLSDSSDVFLNKHLGISVPSSEIHGHKDDMISNNANNTMRKKKLPPLIPIKPGFLRGGKIADIQTEADNDEDEDDGYGYERPPVPLPPRPETCRSTSGSDTDSTGMNSMEEVEIEDKRFNLWKERVNRILKEVPDHIEVEFWDDVDNIRKKSIKMIESHSWKKKEG